ncbi:MAG: right-handed parallel beta-helix repeat-containing protein [Kiritimatiellae bacterium]|nr:right-handed parallel beta-helix repeat-containing protein [Kiritimatiellia bacterium]
MKPKALNAILVAFCWSAFGGTFSLAVTRYVSPGGGSVPPFTNWSDAATSIQVAVDASQNGDSVIVGDGIYSTGSRATPGGVLLNRVVITNNITLQSLNGASNTVIAGDKISPTDPVRCVYMSGQASLIGFTLTNGGARSRATGSWPKDVCGGGLYIASATNAGAYDCVISGNRASSDGNGGGVCTENSYAELIDCIISGNDAGGGGGGIILEGGGPFLANLAIQHNDGGANGGGGVLFYHANSEVRNLLVANNTAGEGGGLYLDGSSPQLDNLTIAANVAPAGYGGGISVSYSSHPVLRNCILWNNTEEQITFNPDWYSMDITISYSDIEGGQAGIVTYGKGPVNWLTGNVDTNPLFVPAGTYALQEASPCIDLGENLGWMSTATDLIGNPRIVNGLVDMGAFEYGVDRDISIRVSAVDIVWFGYLGETYQVQGTMSLVNPVWENVGSPVPGTGAYLYVMDVIRDTGHKHYRVIEGP